MLRRHGVRTVDTYRRYRDLLPCINAAACGVINFTGTGMPVWCASVGRVTRILSISRLSMLGSGKWNFKSHARMHPCESRGFKFKVDLVMRL